MAIRNWWIKASCDGRAKDVELGPQAANGNISVYVRQRELGASIIALKLESSVVGDTLTLRVVDRKGNTVHTETTRR